jgi:hypothetical protein
MPDIPEVEICRTGVTLDVPSFSFLLCWLLLYFITSWILALYKWRRHGFLPPLETYQQEVEFPRVPDPPNGYHTVLIGGGTYGFVRLRTLNGYLIVSFPFFSYQGLCSPGDLHLNSGIM